MNWLSKKRNLFLWIERREFMLKNALIDRSLLIKLTWYSAKSIAFSWCTDLGIIKGRKRVCQRIFYINRRREFDEYVISCICNYIYIYVCKIWLKVIYYYYNLLVIIFKKVGFCYENGIFI